jgi:hypothetical protein
MGAEPWSYFVPYREDIEAALLELQQREFEAGRYRMRDPNNPPATIEEAGLQFPGSGTGTVLDMIGVAEEPRELDSLEELPGFCMVAPLDPGQLRALYGTEKPTHTMVAANQGFFEWIDRGMGIYVIVYAGDTPSKLFFAGYSFD